MSDGQEPYDAFSMDDVDADRPGSGGGGQLPEGGYKFVVTEVVIQNDRGSTQIECEVVEAKDANLVGRKHIEYLKWPDSSRNDEANWVIANRIRKEQLLAWCYAAKTTNPEAIKARQQARQGFDSVWLEAMVGVQLLGYIKPDIYVDAAGVQKSPSKCEGRVWALDNPKGKGIPGWIGTPAVGQATATPQQQAPPTAEQPPPSDNAFDGLV